MGIRFFSRPVLLGSLWLLVFAALGGTMLSVSWKPPTPWSSLPPVVGVIDPNTPPETVFRSLCANCHGTKGEGNPAFKAPSIAGLPDWFILLQIGKFRSGWRGGGGDDAPGAQMRAIALALPDAVIPGVAGLVQALEPVPTVNTLGGDPELGKERFSEQCAACHRYNAHGEKFFQSAPLSSLPDWYLADQLHKFRIGSRGYHGGDVEGNKMRTVMEGVDPKEIEGLVAFIAELSRTYPPAAARWRTGQ